MFGTYPQSVGGANGLQGSFGTVVDVVLTAHATLAAGDVVMLPAAPSFSLSTGEAWYDTTAQTAVPTANGGKALTKRIMGVALNAAASGALVRVRIRGVCNPKVPNGTAAGGPLMVQASLDGLIAGALAAAGESGNIMVAIAIEANATGSAARAAVMFDGLFGFGESSKSAT